MADSDPSFAQLRRLRALDTLAGPDGVVVGVACDHRDSLRAALARRGRPDVADAVVADLKSRVTRWLAPHATVMLLDAELGAGAAIASGALPGSTTLCIALEAQG